MCFNLGNESGFSGRAPLMEGVSFSDLDVLEELRTTECENNEITAHKWHGAWAQRGPPFAMVDVLVPPSLAAFVLVSRPRRGRRPGDKLSNSKRSRLREIQGPCPS